MSRKHSLMMLNPGHFHAALTLRERHPLIDDDVHVFAEDGPDVDKFVQLVHAFNNRPVDPTRWTLYVYRGADFLEKMLLRRPGEVVVIAGRNNKKMECIHLLHGQEFAVLGDKPWLIDSAQLELLKDVTAGPPLAMDIMTERYEITNRLQKAFAGQPSVFGGFRDDREQPAIAIRSVHHLHKTVNQQPLQRPAWYFDTAEQGEGVTDVTTHLVDLVQWMTGGSVPFRFAQDVKALSARQWATAVPRELFSRVTGLKDFPPDLSGRVVNGQLLYLCNAALAYELRGLKVEIETAWDLEEPPGGGDIHRAVLRGTRSDLIVEQGPATQFRPTLSIQPVEPSNAYADALAGAVNQMQDEFPRLAVDAAGKGFRVRIPPTLRTTHEQHFGAVLRDFLTCVDEGRWPENLGSDLETKYTLLARALDLCHHAAADATDQIRFS
jgi:predicted dehydrogenase